MDVVRSPLDEVVAEAVVDLKVVSSKTANRGQVVPRQATQQAAAAAARWDTLGQRDVGPPTQRHRGLYDALQFSCAPGIQESDYAVTALQLQAAI